MTSDSKVISGEYDWFMKAKAVASMLFVGCCAVIGVKGE